MFLSSSRIDPYCFYPGKVNFKNLTSGHARSRSQCGLSRSCCISGDAPWRDEHCGTNPTSLAHFYQKLLSENVRLSDDVIMWPQMTFQRKMLQQRAGNINHSLSDYDSGWVGQIWCILKVPNFSPLTYNGEVTKLTWPKVTDIKNPKYTNCRHLRPYCTLRVSKRSDHWCAFGTMSNFEKRNLRSGHLMWPGGVTFGAIGSSFFFWKCVKLLAETAMENLAALRAAVFSLSAKNLRGEADNRPPAVRRVNGMSVCFFNTYCLIHLLFL